ncbi:MAG: hypothetical protein ACOYMA_14625 [Bacteroidia bacterium]
MKNKLVHLLLFIGTVFSNPLMSQENKTVTLVVSGQGKTQDEAKMSALRSAVEQAYGTFISSKTEILNDNLVKDEIVSVSNGNIQKFEVISEIKTIDGKYATTLKATVSVTKLTSFIESKGFSVEFKGGLFAFNIMMQELNGKSEIIAIKNMIPILKSFSGNSFTYSINAGEPISVGTNWNIPITISVFTNENFQNIPLLLAKTLNNLSLTNEEVLNYNNLKKSVYPITLSTNSESKIYYLRKEESISTIIDFIYSMNSSIINFKITNGVDEFDITKYNIGEKWSYDCNCTVKNLEVFDEDFRLILKMGSDGGNGGGYCPICAASLFHNFCGSYQSSKKPIFNYEEIYKDDGSYDNSYKEHYDYHIEYSTNDRCNIFNSIKYKNFFNLKDIMLVSKPTNFGLVISFAEIKSNMKIVQFKFNDKRTIEEIKQITEYKIIK